MTSTTTIAWPSWLALFTILTVAILIATSPTKKVPPGKYKDSPIWTKPTFQYMSGLIVLIVLGLFIV